MLFILSLLMPALIAFLLLVTAVRAGELVAARKRRKKIHQ